MFFLFFFIHAATTEIYTLSLHDALPILLQGDLKAARLVIEEGATFIGKSEVTTGAISAKPAPRPEVVRSSEPIKAAFGVDRKSTRLNSSHRCISYAVFCLKKKKKKDHKI